MNYHISPDIIRLNFTVVQSVPKLRLLSILLDESGNPHNFRMEKLIKVLFFIFVVFNIYILLYVMHFDYGESF